MANGGVCPITGEKVGKPFQILNCVLVFQDIVMTSEIQQEKKFFGEHSIVPGQETIPSHTSEVMRQVEGAKIPKNGWVCGDAWFGSMSTAIEVYNHFGVHSTWVHICIQWRQFIK